MTLATGVSNQQITKLACRPSTMLRPVRQTASAREAFRELLARHAAGGTVLLPAYIGWSPREGSGILDPVCDLGLSIRFYRMQEDLTVDQSHFMEQLHIHQPKIVLLVHYFGWVDPGCRTLAEMAKDQGSFVIEDSAHAFFTERIGGRCGDLGHASVYSFHKLLPVVSGGGYASSAVQPGGNSPQPIVPWWDYDLRAISNRRTENARYLETRVRSMGNGIRPLWKSGEPGIVPQTFPVLIERYSRDLLYQQMNDAGFGVVSLYHTMVSLLNRSEFPESFAIAGKILNLPVHQDLCPEQLSALADHLERLVS